MPKESEILCKNVFKCKDAETLKMVFTQKWAELISQFEKAKRLAPYL